MPEQATIERVTRLLAYMLRHQPSDFDVELDRFGSADVDDVLHALIERTGDDLDAEDLEAAITSGDRARYDIKNGRIRALYGHSIEIDPGEGSEPPCDLYVGLPASDRDRLERFGLRGGRRRFLHLAMTPEEAREVGRRSAVEYCVVRVDATDAWEQGIDFYDRKSLWMAVELPTYALEVIETHNDGIDPNEGRSGGGGGGDRDRDRGRGGRGRGRGRGGRGRGRGDRDRKEGRSERPKREERPQREERSERPAREERPQREERSERPAREERPKREERSERPAREERPQREERSERPAREERPKREERSERPVREERAAAPKPEVGGFGIGLDDSAPKRKAPVKKAAPKDAPKPAAKVAPKPEPAPAPAPKPAGPSFGDGV